MSNYPPQDGRNHRRTARAQHPSSMNAPSPGQGSAASYGRQSAQGTAQPNGRKPQGQNAYGRQPVQGNPNSRQPQGQNAYGNQPQGQYAYGSQPVSQGWQPSAQSYPGYPQGYQHPSQGVPGGQLPPPQYGAWQQQGYQQPGQPQGYPMYQQPSGRGWTQPYPVQNQQSPWQGGYQVNRWHDNPPGRGAPPAGGGYGGSGGGRRPQPRSPILKLIAAAVVVVIAVSVIVGVISRQNQTRALQAAVSAYDDRYCQGVYVDGIHLGGMTREEAKAVVQKSAQLKCDEWNVSLVTASNEYVGEINSYHLGMTVHVEDALEEAWQQGHTGATADERKAAMDALMKTPFYTSTALPSGDTAAIDRILDDIAASVYVPATNASAVFDPQLTYPFTITKETQGRYLDVQSIKEQVYDMVSRMESGVITIEPTTLYPAVTAADIERHTTLIGTHYTPISTTSTENRNKNIKRACDLINGTIIEPGKSFSFNSVVGARTAKNGFYTAIEYAYGKQVEGYGGGVCQVSSTIYVAAVRANMDILKRTQHALEVNYTSFGLDATVNYDGKKIDFVFQNNTGSNIYIITKVMKKPKVDSKHNLVVCEIYGPAFDAGVTYDLVATTTQVPIPEATTMPDKNAEHVVYTDETYTTKGSVGYEVDSYKVKYMDGKEVERTFMYHDSYAAVAPVIYVGVSERPLGTAEPW